MLFAETLQWLDQQISQGTADFKNTKKLSDVAEYFYEQLKGYDQMWREYRNISQWMANIDLKASQSSSSKVFTFPVTGGKKINVFAQRYYDFEESDE